MGSEFTEATPLGCVVGLLGVGAWIYAGLCAWALHLASKLPAGQVDAHLVQHLWLKLVVGLVIGILLLRLGWRMAMAADMSDPKNPRRPMIRF